MRGVVDIGTNSVRLLITSSTEVVERQMIITRLGRGVDQDGNLSREAMSATVNALRQFKEVVQSYSVSPIVAATSAVRDAANRDEFTAMVKEELGWAVRVLTGEDEARFSFQGALTALKGCLPSGNAAVVDIGGGSTEIFGGTSQGELITGGSVQVGAVRMTERHITGHPILPSELHTMEEEVRSRLKPLVEVMKDVDPKVLVAVGGTATTLAAMMQQLSVYDPEAVTGYVLCQNDLDDIYNQLGKLSVKERQRLTGLDSGRADIIPAGTCILRVVLQLMGFEECIVSDGDLLQGILSSLG